MTQTAKKLKPLANKIKTFENFIEYTETSPFFAAWEKEQPNHGVLSFSSENLNLIFLAKNIWSNPEIFQPFEEKINEFNFAIFLCGEEKELLTSSLSHSDGHSAELMLFPQSETSLDIQIRSVLRSKKLHRQIVEDVRRSDENSKNVKMVLQISRQLNGIRDVAKLLGLILEKAREVTQADAGSIYVVEKETDQKEGAIIFKVSQNESVPQNLSEFRMPISKESIVGNVVLNQKLINIADLHMLSKDSQKNPGGAKHDSSWEKRIGYECHSMLTLPMFDISQQVIGVIQLINCKAGPGPLRNKSDFDEKIRAFNDVAVEYAEIVAHQAGIALENALLTEEKQAMFEGFVDASVNAIEQRDPTTSGHSHRVAKLTIGLAEVVNRNGVGFYKNVFFNDKQIKEIEYASLLHDFGKISVREQVLLKAKKLYPWQMELVLERFELIRSRQEIEHLNEIINFLQAPNLFPPGVSEDFFRQKKSNRNTELADFLHFILKSNEPTILEQGGFERLKDIANLSFKDSQGIKRPYLKPEELKTLSVSRGSLTSEEFSEIQSHVSHTYDFLRKIPWGTDLANVPQIAAKHHEKLDGSGYPTSACAEQIPLQSRMMTIADIFDALTAADRPYKKAVPVDKALDIIEAEVKAKKCDADLFQMFTESKIYQSVL